MATFNFKQLLKSDGMKDDYIRKEIITASRDWKWLLIFAIMAAVLAAIGSAYLFFEIDNERIFQNRLPPPPSSVVIDRGRMEKVLGSFEEKARLFDELSRQAPRVADPSILAPAR